MAYSPITKPGAHFNTVTYTGNGSTNAITGVGFQPDWTWLKGRSVAYSHTLFDAVRGVTKRLETDGTGVESTLSTGLTSFDTDGFSLGSSAAVNQNTDTFVSWNWKANNSAGSSNSDGTITSTVAANTTAGFSIIKYAGTGTANQTFGHGLGVKPQVLIIKSRTSSDNWHYWQDTDDNGTANQRLLLNSTATNYNNYFVTFGTNTITLPSINDSGWSASGQDYIAYCFAEKQGYSDFGYYIGNGNTNGPFIYTGFRPAFVLQKRVSTTENWHIFDNTRDTINVAAGADDALRPNLNNAEISNWGVGFDFFANGFKATATDGAINQNSGVYIYMAFAENPLVANVGVNGIPALSR